METPQDTTPVPPTMRVARAHHAGEPAVLGTDTVATPIPGPGEVLVRVHAAAANFPDALMVANRYQVATNYPFVPGYEAAGVIAARGNGSTAYSLGDRVAVLAADCFAEYVVAPETALTPVPAAVDLESAAAVFVCHLTAYHALRSVAGVRPGETLLVLGAGGGVGLAAVELGTHLGARVIAAASSQDKLAAARTRGAVHTVDYGSGELRERIRGAVGKSAVDVVIDPVGGALAEPALREMAWGGRFVTIGYASGTIPRIPLNLVLLKGITLSGFEIRTFAQRDPERDRRDRQEFLELWASGAVTPLLHRRYRLDEAGAALAEVAQRRAVGKVLVIP
ncbi:NADPH:quinone oxidoreductase family protein [Nocardia jinanensis]|nr:NADPH:quinone oxidoreductase family protein [Nocardia jinanensis]